jgi:hypothetical protein
VRYVKSGAGLTEDDAEAMIRLSKLPPHIWLSAMLKVYPQARLIMDGNQNKIVWNAFWEVFCASRRD